MTAPPQSSYCTPEEYLQAEKISVDKHEWIDGQMIAMAGGSLSHSAVTSNLIRSIGNQLVASRVELLTATCVSGRLQPSFTPTPTSPFFCGPPQFDPIDRSTGSIINPTLIAEVLSPSTERYDRDEKFRKYLSIPTLREYVLVAQHEPYIEVRAPRDDGSWLVTPYSGLAAKVRFASIEIEIPLSEVYDGVDFSSAD